MKRRICRVAKIIASVSMSFLIIISSNAYASSIGEAEQEKQDAEDNKSQAEEILERLEAEKNDIEVYIEDLDGQLDGLQAQIEDLNAKKDDLESRIVGLQEQVELAQEAQNAQYAAMCARIQFMYENSSVNYVEALLSAESMSDILNEPEYAQAMTQYDYDLLNRLIDARQEVIAAEQALEEDLSAIEEVVAQVEEQESTINTLKAAKEEEMKVFEEDIEAQEKLIAQYDAEIQAASAQIAAIEAAAQAELERAQREQAEREAAEKAAQEAQNSGENTDNSNSDNDNSNSNNSNSDSSNSSNAEPVKPPYTPYQGGSLTWPVPSSYKINSGFGRREASGVVTANHYGIDIGCANGTPCVAAASGVVVLSQYSSSAGNWIIISHGNGLYTIYMHASAVYVSAGQYVNAGDTIMLSGATGATQGRHLHFEVRVGGYNSGSKYSVDPMGYF